MKRPQIGIQSIVVSFSFCLNMTNKYNVFAEIKPAVLLSVTQYRITGNYDYHTHCSSLITIHYYGQEKIRMFSYRNAMEMGLKLEERKIFMT